jgi:hypothetical protein
MLHTLVFNGKVVDACNRHSFFCTSLPTSQHRIKKRIYFMDLSADSKAATALEEYKVQ